MADGQTELQHHMTTNNQSDQKLGEGTEGRTHTHTKWWISEIEVCLNHQHLRPGDNDIVRMKMMGYDYIRGENLQDSRWMTPRFSRCFALHDYIRS